MKPKWARTTGEVRMALAWAAVVALIAAGATAAPPEPAGGRGAQAAGCRRGTRRRDRGGTPGRAMPRRCLALELSA